MARTSKVTLRKPLKSLWRTHRHFPRMLSLDEAVNRLTRETERLNNQCDQQVRVTKKLFERMQQMAGQLEGKLPDLTRSGFDFLDSDLDVGLTLARLAAAAAPNTDRRIRNRQAAHRVLETVQRFSSKWRLTETQRHDLANKITSLKEQLDAS